MSYNNSMGLCFSFGCFSEFPTDMSYNSILSPNGGQGNVAVLEDQKNKK